MLNFSFSTVLLCAVTSNLLIFFLYLILRNNRVLAELGYKLLGFILFIIGLRMILPIEFVPICTTLHYPRFISMIFSNIRHPRFHIGNIQFSFWGIFMVIWMIGIVYLLWKQHRNHIQLIKYLNKNQLEAPIQYHDILDSICLELHKKNSFQIILLENIQVPIALYWNGPCIAFPTGLSLNEQELYFILRHEIQHFINKDFLLKKFISLLCIIYWWNPICHLLKKQCNLLFELRVDNHLTQKNEQTKAAYLSTLIQVAQKSNRNFSNEIGISFCSANSSVLIKRFQALTISIPKTRRNYLLSTSVIVVVASLYILSYLFIFEAFYIPDALLKEVVPCTKDNTYAIDNLDGTYDICTIMHGKEVWETVDSLKYYPDGMKIMKKGDFNGQK